MTNQSTARPLHLREFRPDDIPAFAEIVNRVFPDEPITVEAMEHWEKTYPKDNPRLRYVGEEHALEPNADRKLFDLYVAAMADVPFPGGARPQAQYENWRSWMLEGPTVDTTGIFVAKLGDDYIGLTALELPESGPAITSTTGVLPEHRGHGVAMTLKLLSFRFAAQRGYQEIRAHNDTANPPILRMNEKLGYRRLPGWLTWEKLPQRDQTA